MCSNINNNQWLFNYQLSKESINLTYFIKRKLLLNQQLKQKVEFQKFEKNLEKVDLQQLQHKLQELKQKQKDEFAVLGDLQSQLKQKVQNTQKFKQLLSDIENQDFREILIDDKTIEESLNSIILEHFTKNQALLKEQTEQIKYAKEDQEQQYCEQQNIQQKPF